MKTELENVLPQDIEKRSFEIITEELGEVSLIPVQDFKKNFLFWKRCAIIKKQTLQNCSS